MTYTRSEDYTVPLLDSDDNDFDNVTSIIELNSDVIKPTVLNTNPLPALNVDVIKLLSLHLPYVKDLYHYRLTSKQINEFVEQTPSGKLARAASNLFPYSISISLANSNLVKGETALDYYAEHCGSNCRDAYVDNCIDPCPSCSCKYCCCYYYGMKSNWIGMACGAVASISTAIVGSNYLDPANTYFFVAVIGACVYFGTMGSGVLIQQGFFSCRKKILDRCSDVDEIKNKLKEPICDDKEYEDILSSMKLKKS